MVIYCENQQSHIIIDEKHEIIGKNRATLVIEWSIKDLTKQTTKDEDIQWLMD